MSNNSSALPGDHHYWRAFAFSWLFYMCMSLAEYYDGILTWIGQPIMGAVFSGVTVATIALLGLLLRIPQIGRAWRKSHPLPVIIIVGGLLLLICGSTIGLTETYVDSETETVHSRLHGVVSVPAFLGVIFAIAHWPTRILTKNV